MSQVSSTPEVLRTAVNLMTDGLVILNDRLEIEFHNPAAFVILGYKPEHGPLEYINPRCEVLDESLAPRPSVFFPVEAAFRTKTAQLNQIIGVRCDSEDFRWLSVTATPDATTGRAVVTLRHVGDDSALTLRVAKAQGRMFDRQQFLDTTLNALPCLVSYIDRNMVYRYCNKAYENWFTTKNEHRLNRSLPEMLGESAFAAVRPHLEAALSGRVSRFDADLDYKGTGPMSVSATYIPGVDAAGNVQGAYCIVQDISPQIQSKNLVIQKEQEISKLINNIPGLVGWWDANLLNLHANLAYARYFGISPKDIKGKHIREVVGEDLYRRNIKHIEGVLNGEPQNFERELIMPDGGVEHILTSYIPDQTDGRVHGFFAVTTDVTRIKDAEASQREAESRLVSNAKMAALGEMAGGIAHEINNPLAIIHGKAGQIQRALKSDSFDVTTIINSVNKIESTAARISKIVKGLRSFSRNADADPMQTVAVDKIIEDTLELNTEMFRKSGVALKLKTAPGVTLECRPVEISQVLMNLLTNAFHAVQSLSERWIKLEVNATVDRVMLTVTDSGRGITPEVTEKMMQPFFTTKDVGQGTGLGLSISKGIAEAHRGSLRYVPNADHTTFVLELPRAPGEIWFREDASE